MRAEPDAYRAFRGQRYFGSLDGVRAASILAVVWHHSTPEEAKALLFYRGFLGVDMFFVLSGFLIVTLLLRERESTGDISLRGFYLRRTFRIFPLYYGIIAAVTLLVMLRPGGQTASLWWHDLPILLTYTANWFHPATFMGVAWSLAAEEQFYLVWPPLERWLRRFVPWILLAAIAASQAIQFGLADPLLAALGFGPEEPGMLRQTTFTPILLGVVLAHLLHEPRFFRRFHAVLAPKWTPFALLVPVVALCAFGPPDLSGWPRATLHVLLTLFLASVVVREDNGLAPVMKLWAVRRIGIVSYGMYLFHMIVVDVVGRGLELAGVAIPGALFVGTLLGTWAVAELSFRYYETPFNRLKNRFKARPAAAPTPRAA